MIKGNEIVTRQTINKGIVNEAAQEIMDDWVRRNNVNSYLIIEDYITNEMGEEEVYNRYYIYDNYDNPKLDHYQELDIKNTGLNFRVLQNFSSDEYYKLEYKKKITSLNIPQ